MALLQHLQHFIILLSILVSSHGSLASDGKWSWLWPRADCRYTRVRAGEGCFAVADRCGISQANLEKFNGGGSFCQTLVVDQYVCCSAGTLPDFTPQPNPDGSCRTYTVKEGDSCSAIAEANQMESDQLRDRNLKTWGFAGCSFIYPGQKICLSTGSAPMPASIPNAICGPQVNDTAKPADMSKLAGLNPCPLKACCNKWGQCGITSEFCTKSESETGAPGTSKNGTNGCISNCGTDIVNKGTPPASFMRLGYYESFSLNRPCLAMRPSQIPTGYYTHLHYAFGDISSEFDVDMSATQDLFTEFRALRGVKRIMSFGGWAFSTEPGTAPIFREGVSDAQRQTFATNVASFVVDNNLDGVDFDWEYPGAPDIPGIPPGGKNDGTNYLAFLKLVRAALPAAKTVSIAAPASYWYLRGFPIAEMAPILDYIVYMTYDIHGQWDYGNKWANPGCEQGNCLRSHVNLTETTSALSMITKAGVPTNKLLLGMALYGRSFEMSQAGCHTEMCEFTGPNSGASPGICTNTRGYISNWEIRRIIADSSIAKEEFHSEEAGDILVYDSTQWVAWMKPDTYQSRVDLAQSLNMGGLSDWAIDLDVSGNGGDGSSEEGSGVVFISPDIYEEPDPTVYCIPPCTFVLPPMQLSSQTRISQPPLTRTVTEVYPSKSTNSGGITQTVFLTFIDTTTITVPPVTRTEIELWNINWTDTNWHTFSLTSSVVFPPITTTQDSVTTTINGTTFSTTGITYSYSVDPWPPVTTKPDPPPTQFPPIIVVSSGNPGPTCRPGQKCGHLCESNCFPEPGCIGLCDCIGLGCPECLTLPCQNCIGPGCVGGGGGGGGGGEDEPTTCSEKSTVTDCSVACSVTPRGSTLSTSCYTTTCSETTVCQSIGTTTTSRTTVGCSSKVSYPPWHGGDPNAAPVTLGDGPFGGYVVGAMDPSPPPPVTSFIECEHQNQSPGLGILSGYCVCDGSTFADKVATQVTPWNSCGYTAKPTEEITVTTQMTVTTDIPDCQVCTLIGHNQECTSLENCTPEPTAPPLPEPRCVTAHVFLDNCIWGGDTMTIRVWEAGVRTCATGDNKQLASGETGWNFDCDDGATAFVTNNGRELSYKASDGWEASIPQTDGHWDTYDCGTATGSQYEYVFANDRCEGCQTAELCDYRSYCSDFEGTCD